ncbi:MAG: isoaspartyl peptidase/L-asparaginase [Burkholderiales bacterium]|nr:isoaspartyl peptidase/L-asparaginase [Burkholderiales bacterium]
MTSFAIAIHGGAGTIGRADLSREEEAAYRTALQRAIHAGHRILAAKASSLDAVTAAVVALEDDPLFNAGRGAVFNAAGEHELDAAIMDGATLRAGSVAAVKRTRNPILAARAVMEKTRHVMLFGEGADRFAEAQGLEMVAADYFHTDHRWQALSRMRQRKSTGESATDADKHGTVGAVALDGAGNLAAATSTGGYTHKMAGRVGDSPIIGAGTYAGNDTCAISGTGEGEYFIRLVLGHEIAARMRYLKESLHEAARRVVMEQLPKLGGSGGIVAIDRQGNIAMPFNTSGMYRASIDVAGQLKVAIYGD